MSIEMKFKVEWLEGYGESHPKGVTLAELRTEDWNMAAIFGDDWEDDVTDLSIGEDMEFFEMNEHIRFTRTN